MVQLMSERLLRKEIERINSKENLDSDDIFVRSLYQKELVVLQKLAIEGIDLCGSIHEVEKRINNQSLYFIEKEKYDDMVKKTHKYDAIQDIVYC